MPSNKFIHPVTLDPTGPPPEVEVLFGNAQVGTYRCDLWPGATATQSQPIAHGNNVDSIADRFPIPEAADTLPGKYLGFALVIQAPDPGPGEMFSVIILIRQGGHVVSDGLIQDNGAFPAGSDTVARVHYVKFA